MNASHDDPIGTTNIALAEWPPRTWAECEHLRDRAIIEAPALRRQAIADFWHDTDALLVGAIRHGRRAADRLAARLRQHAKRRRAANARTIEA